METKTNIPVNNLAVLEKNQSMISTAAASRSSKTTGKKANDHKKQTAKSSAALAGASKRKAKVPSTTTTAANNANTTSTPPSAAPISSAAASSRPGGPPPPPTSSQQAPGARWVPVPANWRARPLPQQRQDALAPPEQYNGNTTANNPEEAGTSRDTPTTTTTIQGELVADSSSASESNRLYWLLVILVGCLALCLVIVVIILATGGGSNDKAIAIQDGASPRPNIDNTNPPAASLGEGSLTTLPTIVQVPTLPQPPISSLFTIGESIALVPSNYICGTRALRQVDYRGTTNVTWSGKPCQPWNSQYPHRHNRIASNFPGRDLEGNHNYCRNMDGESAAWCYTMDPNVRLELCNIPDCHFCGFTKQDAENHCRGTCLNDADCWQEGQSCYQDTTCAQTRLELPDNQHYVCGRNYANARQSICRAADNNSANNKACPSGFSNECNGRETCFLVDTTTLSCDNNNP